jgi:hypothetical protein
MRNSCKANDSRDFRLHVLGKRADLFRGVLSPSPRSRAFKERSTTGPSCGPPTSKGPMVELETSA